MITLTIANHKGGSTKSTTAVHLAVGLTRRGYRVLFIDADAAGSGTRWLGLDQPIGPNGEVQTCIVDVIISSLISSPSEQVPWEEVIEKTAIENLWVIPSIEKMQEADPQIMQLLHKALKRDKDVLIRLNKPDLDVMDLECLMARRLPDLPPNWDFCVLDTPPGMSLVTRNALVATDWVIIPVDMSPMTLDGTGSMLHYLEGLRQRHGKPIKILGVLATVVENNTLLSQKLLIDLHTHFVEDLFGTKIRKTVKLKEASGWHRSAYDYMPQEWATYEYDRFCDEVLSRLKAKGVILPSPSFPPKPLIAMPTEAIPPVEKKPKKKKQRRKSILSSHSENSTPEVAPERTNGAEQPLPEMSAMVDPSVQPTSANNVQNQPAASA